MSSVKDWPIMSSFHHWKFKIFFESCCLESYSNSDCGIVFLCVVLLQKLDEFTAWFLNRC